MSQENYVQKVNEYIESIFNGKNIGFNYVDIPLKGQFCKIDIGAIVYIFWIYPLLDTEMTEMPTANEKVRFKSFAKNIYNANQYFFLSFSINKEGHLLTRLTATEIH